MLDARLRRLIDPPLDRVSAPLAAHGLSANAATVAGFLIGLGAALAIAGRAYLLGLGLLLLNRLLDGLDGALARRQGLTDLGGFLDIVLDFLIYAAVPFAFALADPASRAEPWLRAVPGGTRRSESAYRDYRQAALRLARRR